MLDSQIDHVFINNFTEQIKFENISKISERFKFEYDDV